MCASYKKILIHQLLFYNLVFVFTYMEKHIFNWRPDTHDQRDYKFSSVRKVVELPKIVDLRSKMTPVEDQGQIGSCGANAGVGLLEFMDNNPDNKYTNLSRLFLYYNTRLLEGTVNFDSGCTIRGTMKAIGKYGVCTEHYWPYTVSKFKVKPSVKAYTDGVRRTISGYYKLRTLGEIKASLAEGIPVMFGFTVYENFESYKVEKTGILEMPVAGEAALGGHACLLVGYNDIKKRLIVRNSWGRSWGDNGYFYMPYDYVTKKIASDFWTIR
jgi:C1A family cysteine protease